MQYSEHFAKFWRAYDAKPIKKGSKRKAYEAWQKKGKQWCKDERRAWPEDEEAFFAAVHGGYLCESEARKAARQVGEWLPDLPMMTTYLNQHRWEHEMEMGAGDYKRQAIETQCRCGEPGTLRVGEGFACEACYRADHDAAHTQLLRDQARKMHDESPRQEGESWADWAKRLMKTQKIGQRLPY